MKRIYAKVTGKVQGVFYRASTRDVAENLRLNGWVRNMPDGSVELEAEGPEDKINQLIDWLHHGPQYAIVEKVKIEEVQPNASQSGFIVVF